MTEDIIVKALVTALMEFKYGLSDYSVLGTDNFYEVFIEVPVKPQDIHNLSEYSEDGFCIAIKCLTYLRKKPMALSRLVAF